MIHPVCKHPKYWTIHKHTHTYIICNTLLSSVYSLHHHPNFVCLHLFLFCKLFTFNDFLSIQKPICDHQHRSSKGTREREREKRAKINMYDKKHYFRVLLTHSKRTGETVGCLVGLSLTQWWVKGCPLIPLL